jgi:hypothetical protein
MVWQFPLGVPFDVWLGNGRVIGGCVFVCADEESFTVDYDVLESFGRIARTRGQFRMDLLLHIAHRTPIEYRDPAERLPVQTAADG